ncbi:MAG TPA: transposase [Polyangiaceae bacterium]|jgi:REP element-mobilizing transposase RayT|nr:transposase [Polyangiaceae bacterium]
MSTLVFDALRAARERFGTRLVQLSAQSNHVRLIVETESKDALSRAMQGLGGRIAYRLNKRWRRHGQVLADRYHSRVLKTPLEVKRALVYVLQNHRHHAVGVAPPTPAAFDELSTAPYFDGFTVRVRRPPRDAPVVPARTWLLRVGWKVHGLITPDEVPA